MGDDPAGSQNVPRSPERDWPGVLRKVALIYASALAEGMAPTCAVADAFDVPRSTAGRWVTRARDRGYLAVTDPRGTPGRRPPARPPEIVSAVAATVGGRRVIVEVTLRNPVGITGEQVRQIRWTDL